LLQNHRFKPSTISIKFQTETLPGIGLACARAFLAEGARVGITSRSQANIDQAYGSLPGAIGIAADLCDADQAQAMVTSMVEQLGAIDILVNSAGAAARTPPDQLTPARWRAAMDAKFFSYINVIDVVVKQMAARKSGVIVNIIGNGGKVASVTHVAGGAANAALMLATVGLASAYADRGIRIVGINPGLTNTGRVQEGMKAEASILGVSIEEALRRTVTKIPLGRAAEPEEIANTALFLASDRASYITGVNISMDGASTPLIA